MKRYQAAALRVPRRLYSNSVLSQRQYQRADIFVLPGWSEGFPTVVAEAMDVGLLIVRAREQGMADHLAKRVNALLVPPRDPPGLAAAIDRLLEDASLRGLVQVRQEGARIRA